MRQQAMRDLGQLGESVFQKWAAEMGLIVNYSKIDKAGWDFLVEFPCTETHSAAESAPAPIECKIQIKATDTLNKNNKIKISNLLRLAKSPIPTFIILISFDGGNEAQEARLVHFDENLISRIMKRVREIDQSPEQNRFNKRTITLPFGEDQRLPSLDGLTLAAMISKYIPSGLEEYVKRKQEILTRVGYEGISMEGSFSTSNEVGVEGLINASLGLAESVEITNLIGHDCRFGIRERHPSLNWEMARLSFPEVEPNLVGSIEFKVEDREPPITTECRIYNSPLNRHLPDKYKKLRISGKFFDLWIKPHSGEANFTFSLEGKHFTIQMMRKATMTLGMLAVAKKVFLKIESNDLPELDFSITPNSINPSWRLLEDLGNACYNLAAFFDIDLTSPIEFDQLVNDSKELSRIHNMINTPAELTAIEFSLSEEIRDGLEKCCCQFFVWCRIGDFFAGAVFSYSGVLLGIPGNRFRLAPKKLEVMERILTKSCQGFDEGVVARALSRADDKYEKAGFTVIQIHS